MFKSLIASILLAAGISMATAAEMPHEPCIDIDGTSSKVIVMPGTVKGNARLENPTWQGDDRTCWVRMTHPRLVPGGEWIPLEFTFIPGSDGELIVWLRSNQAFDAGKKPYPTWVEYRNISISCVPPVAGFAKSADKSGKNGWLFASPETLVKNGKKDTVAVWHDSVAFCRIKVSAWQEVTVKLEARFLNK